MVTVQLTDAAAAALAARAAAQGLSLQGFLEQLAQADTEAVTPRITADEFERLLDEETTHGPSPQGTFSRAEIYRDHD